VKREILISFEFEVGNCMIDRFGPGETALSDGIRAQGNETAIARSANKRWRSVQSDEIHIYRLEVFKGRGLELRSRELNQYRPKTGPARK
jgi:hypothetical protein